MKQSLRRLLLSIWTVGATLIIARLWLTHPDAVPRLPEAFWLWLIAVYGSKDGEDLATLELLVALTLSFAIVAAVTLLAVVALRRIRGR